MMVNLKVNRYLFSLTEARTVEVQADMGKNVDLSQIVFQFGGKSLSEWKKWTSSSNFNGDPFITIMEEPHFVEGTTIVKATLEFGLLFNRSSLAMRTIRTQYQKFIGYYELAMIDPQKQLKAATTVKLNVYDEFLFYQQLKPELDQIFDQANKKNDRYLKYQSLGKSVQGRDLHFVILARDKAAVDRYLNETLPTALENPNNLLGKLATGTMGDYQVPIWFNNIHPDEVEGADAQVALMKKFALGDTVTFKTIKDQQKRTITLNVDEVLDDVILLFMFTNNPDGRVTNTRRNTNGFDLNRDNHFQTQVETHLVTQEIAKWTPLSFFDMHGYTDGFLIEPATPPHNPNYEYDLLYNQMIEQAHSMGQAGIGNSDFHSYLIPALDYQSGWDDMSPGYTPSYAMLHGSLAHTIEIPALSQNGLRAMVGVGLGAIQFVTENKDKLYIDQLKIFKRGVNGEDNREVDKYFVNALGESIGRIRGKNLNFFPDYYLIPFHQNQQKNNLEAHRMVQYLLRNGVKVKQTTKYMKINGRMYPTGTFIIPMNQAKRGFANAMLYKGENVSDWGAMYDPIVADFPDLRGFTITEIRNAAPFDQYLIETESVTTPTGKVILNIPKQVLSNTNNDTINLVNVLLKNGAIVEKVMETNGVVMKGDFIIRTSDLQAFGSNYYFEAKPVDPPNPIKTKQLMLPKVAVMGASELKYAVKELGFELVKQENADVIVSDSSSLLVSNLSGKSYIGMGMSALTAVKNRGLLAGFNFQYTRNGHEGLVKAKIKDHILTSGYKSDELLYTTSGAWITSIPVGAKILASFSDRDDFYVAGWWPQHENAKGKILAFTHTFNDTTVTLFANELAYRAHPQSSYRFIANCIFDSVGF
jgi:hypothetical protein